VGISPSVDCYASDVIIRFSRLKNQTIVMSPGMRLNESEALVSDMPHQLCSDTPRRDLDE
jgi:hypothetical protein